MTVSFVTRTIALSHELDSSKRQRLNVLSHRFLAASLQDQPKGDERAGAGGVLMYLFNRQENYEDASPL